MSLHIFSLGFAIYWCHTCLPPTFYNKIASMGIGMWFFADDTWRGGGFRSVGISFQHAATFYCWASSL